MSKHVINIVFLLNLYFPSNAQNDSLNIPIDKKGRLKAVVITGGALYGTSMAGLYHLWYKDYPQSRFHFFNDNSEWMQMDKIGHFATSYNIGRMGIGIMKWTGIKRKKAIWWGGLSGLIYLTNIEILDGFSSNWGFSIGDMTANTLGSALTITEALLWDEQRIMVKFSFHQSPYSKYRPNELGGSLKENILKDYNGQTYWLSCNIYSFLNKGSKFPKWLNLALGYGADGMIGGTSNPIQINGIAVPEFVRYRQYYISFDFNFKSIHTRSKVLKVIFNAVDFIKVPGPALELNSKSKGIHFHPFYF